MSSRPSCSSSVQRPSTSTRVRAPTPFPVLFVLFQQLLHIFKRHLWSSLSFCGLQFQNIFWTPFTFLTHSSLSHAFLLYAERVQALISGFNKDWKVAIAAMNDDVMRAFTNFKASRANYLFPFVSLPLFLECLRNVKKRCFHLTCRFFSIIAASCVDDFSLLGIKEIDKELKILICVMSFSPERDSYH